MSYIWCMHSCSSWVQWVWPGSQADLCCYWWCRWSIQLWNDEYSLQETSWHESSSAYINGNWVSKTPCMIWINVPVLFVSPPKKKKTQTNKQNKTKNQKKQPPPKKKKKKKHYNQHLGINYKRNGISNEKSYWNYETKSIFLSVSEHLVWFGPVDQRKDYFCKARNGSLSSFFSHFDVPFQTIEKGCFIVLMNLPSAKIFLALKSSF